MIRINQIKLGYQQNEEALKHKVCSLLHIGEKDLISMTILRKSLDARKKPELFFIYAVDVAVKEEDKVLKKVLNKKGMKEQISKSDTKAYEFPVAKNEKEMKPIVVVGAGPAGLFCAYYLVKHGFPVILLERGKCVEERMEDVEAFWKTGRLHVASNVQFGEGGAGTFSDGKLNTLVKDKDGRNHAVLETFVHFGAKESILYDAKPHIGTDVLCNVVKAMREEIIRLGGKVSFETKVTNLILEEDKNAGADPENHFRRIKGVMLNGHMQLDCNRLVLAIGHSARDTFRMLQSLDIPMEAKDFAVGFRVEHPQDMINESQYGFKDEKNLGAAAYKLAAKTTSGRGVYSFCMCPGGYVVNASSEEGRLAVNGMSYSGRDSGKANSAIIVSVTRDDYPTKDALGGVAFQEELEAKAFALANGKIPVQSYMDFKNKVELGKDTKTDVSELKTKGDYESADLSGLLTDEMNHAFVEGMDQFGRMIKGFDGPDAWMLGIESRTSSPVRILRNHNLQSEIFGLYPAGEGAGYAGGITSAAMDGIRIAEQIALSTID